MAPSPFWIPPSHVRPHELPHHQRRRNAADAERTRTFTNGDMGVQKPASRSQRSAPVSIPRDQGLARIVPPPHSVATEPQGPLLDTHMSSLPLSGDALLCLPNLVMRGTMNYADRVARRERLRYLRGLTDVETGMSSEDMDEFLRMLTREDGDEGDGTREDGDEGDGTLIGEVSIDLTGQGKEKRIERLSATGKGSDLARDEDPRRELQNPWIGLPAQSRQRTVQVRKEDRKQLRPTPVELTAPEHEDGVQNIAIDTSSSWPPTTLRDAPREFRRNPTVLLNEDQKTDTEDLGWPPLEELFADLPEPVTPVFRKEDVCSPVQTIWSRHEKPRSVSQHPVEDLNGSWLSQGHQTEEPDELISKASSEHSSTNHDPPSELLAELKLEESKPEDPSIFLNGAFAPILAFLYQEWNTGRLLHRHLRSTLGNPHPDSPPTSTEADTVLTHEQCEVRIALTNECRQHIEELKKWYRNTRALMKLTIETMQSAAAFRFGIENGNAEQLALEMLRSGGDGSGAAEVPSATKVCGEI